MLFGGQPQIFLVIFFTPDPKSLNLTVSGILRHFMVIHPTRNFNSLWMPHIPVGFPIDHPDVMEVTASSGWLCVTPRISGLQEVSTEYGNCPELAAKGTSNNQV